jgi:hypothetical protein
VTLSGPTQGKVHLDYTFTADALPITATLPLTYAWQADGFPVITQTGAISSTQDYAWSTPGAQTITVTVSNPVSSLVQTATITIEPYWVYLPMQRK